jgi:hypothetical protein
VIAATDETALTNCLGSLLQECHVNQVALLIAHKNRPDLVQAASGLGFSVRGIECAANSSIFEMRKAAMQFANTDLVASVGERYALAEGWMAAGMGSGDWDVLTGNVAPPRRLSATGWSIYLAEYAHFTISRPAGVLDQREAILAAGGNSVYRTALVLQIPENTESAFHDRLSKSGNRFVRSGGLTVEFAFPPSFREYLRERYWLSFEWGTQQGRAHSRLVRAALSFSRLALPPLLLFRRCRSIWTGRRYRLHLLYSLPLLAVYSFVEMLGEIVGLMSDPLYTRRIIP